MATYTLGRVGIVAKGEYSSTTTYVALDLVSYQGISYIAKLTSTGIVPTNTTYWMPAVQGSGTSTSDATAYASDLLSGKTAYARGSKITGTIPNYSGSYSVTPTASSQTLATAGTYLASNITVGGASSYSAYTGSYAYTPQTYAQTVACSGKVMNQNVTISAMSPYEGSYTVTPTTSSQTLATAGKYLDKNITVGAASSGGQTFKSKSGSQPAPSSGYTATIDVGFVPRMVALLVQKSGTTHRFLVVYNADANTNTCWQSNDSGGYHTYTTATVSGTFITFNFKTNAGSSMATTGTITWQATGY